MTKEEMIDRLIGRHCDACRAAGVEPENLKRLKEEISAMPDNDIAEMLAPAPWIENYEPRSYGQYTGKLEMEF